METNAPVPIDERTRGVTPTNEWQPREMNVDHIASRAHKIVCYTYVWTNVDDLRHPSSWADAGKACVVLYSVAYTYYVSRVGLLSQASSSELSERWFTRSGAYSTPGWHGPYSTDGRHVNEKGNRVRAGRDSRVRRIPTVMDAM